MGNCDLARPSVWVRVGLGRKMSAGDHRWLLLAQFGANLGLLGGLAAILDVVYHIPLLANLSLVALCGLMLGLANGYMTAYLRIPSFIVGLGGMLAFRGILLGITGGTTIAPVSPSLVYVGQGYLPHSVGVGLGAGWKSRRARKSSALH